MIINGVAIEDTFAEAFGMRATRLIITADTADWAETAAAKPDRLRHLGHRLRLRGRRSSARWQPDETPDGRPGIAVLIFAINSQGAAEAAAATASANAC